MNKTAAQAFTRQRFCILANEKSGQGSDRPGLSDLADGLRARGMDVDLRRLKKGEDFAGAARRAISSDADAIIAAGGDGTISGIAAALAGTQTPMGIIPLGTFNYFARSLDIPQDVEQALDVIAANHRTTTNIGMINDQVFLNNASLGIYPQILKTRETTYARWGRSRIAAYWSVIWTMARLPRPLHLQITANGQPEKLKTPLAFVISNAFQLREMGLEGAECVEAGQLALLIAQNTGRLGMLRNGAALLLGRAEKGRNFRLICAQSLELRSTRKSLLVARDGERGRMKGPFNIEMKVDALRVIAPPKAEGQVR